MLPKSKAQSSPRTQSKCPVPRLSKAERIARTEPWIQAENPDYVPVWDTDVPPLPRNPEGGKILDPEPKPLPFAAKASPIVGIEAER